MASTTSTIWTTPLGAAPLAKEGRNRINRINRIKRAYGQKGKLKQKEYVKSILGLNHKNDDSLQ